MGLTSLKIPLAALSRPSTWIEVEFLIDSGAVFTVVPGKVLRRLGVRPEAKEEFFLANGERIVRRMGIALFKIGRKRRASPVVSGPGATAPFWVR